ncbi:MAG: hypothetical protein LC804_13025 [Acidobacteria bacterium]|nr:hypothetical protein [Acidobacteriota bacterium]
MASRPRIVIASPHPAECEILADWLASDGFEPVQVSTVVAAAGEMQSRAFDILISDFAFAFRDGLQALGRSRTRNPQAPVIVLGDASALARAHAERRQAMYLERPVEHAALVCLVSMAIIDGRPARRSLRKAVSRLEAVVDGAPSYIIDVSNEGLRLEIPRDGRLSSKRHFIMRVPIIGVALVVQRKWTSSRPARQDVAWCGGALEGNPPHAEQGWRALVDALPAVGVPG